MKLVGLDIARRARARLTRYLVVGRWLFSVIRKFARAPFYFVPVLSVAALALQIASLALAARFIGHFQTGASTTHVNGELTSTPGGPLAIAAIIAILLALSGLARYRAGKLAIQAYSDVAIGLTGKVLEAIQALPGVLEKWRLLKATGRRDLLRIVSTDVNRCGLATRILLANTINLFFLVAGLVFFLWASPAIFGGLLVIAVIGAVLAYPLNLKAVAVANAADAARRGHKGLLSDYLDATLGTASGALARMRDGEAVSAERRFLVTLTDRYAVIESSRFVLSILFALVIGAILALVVLDKGHLLFDYTRLLVLFIAFRFTYQGLQGLLICATTINRFLPAMLRVENLLSQVDRSRDLARAVGSAKEPKALETRAPAFRWKIEADNSPLRSGALEPGRLHIIVERAKASPDVVFRLLDILTADQARFARQFVDGEVQAPPTLSEDGGRATAQIGPTSAPPIEPWIEAALRDLSADAACPAADGRQLTRQHAVGLLSQIDAVAKRGAQLVVVRDGSLLSLPQSALDALTSRVADRAILVITPWVATLRPTLRCGSLLVSNGHAFAFAAQCSAMTSESWERAHQVYVRTARGNGAASDDDIDDLDLED